MANPTPEGAANIDRAAQQSTDESKSDGSPFNAFALLSELTPSTVRVETYPEEEGSLHAAGSGVFVSSGDANICEAATVNHVTNGAEHVAIFAPNGLVYDGRLELADRENEIAIYQLQPVFDAKDVCKPAKVRTTDLPVGELALGVSDAEGAPAPVPYIAQSAGNILRSMLSSKLPALEGENLDREMGYTMARFLPADSGGGLFDRQGEVVGLMTAYNKSGMAAFEKGQALQADLDKVRQMREEKARRQNR